MYGLPKTPHKPNNSPLHFIYGPYNAPSFRIAKYHVLILEHLITNQYTIKNSYSFQTNISKPVLPINSFHVSYGVTIIFTTMIPCKKLLLPIVPFYSLIQNSSMDLIKQHFESFCHLLSRTLASYSLKYLICMLIAYPWVVHLAPH